MIRFLAPREESQRIVPLGPHPALFGEDKLSVSVGIANVAGFRCGLVPLHLKELMVRGWWGVRCRLQDLSAVAFSRQVGVVLLAQAKIRRSGSRKQLVVSITMLYQLFISILLCKEWEGGI